MQKLNPEIIIHEIPYPEWEEDAGEIVYFDSFLNRWVRVLDGVR